MDKLRFKQPSGFSGGVEVLPKSNKERIKKLSTIGSWRFQMGGCRVSNDDDELPTKFSIHLGSSVPRKLRSAMKNRRRQSTSPYLPRKLTSGIKSLGCNGVKRPCLKQGDRGDRETVNVTITKDEEEVVETLYALAGLVFLGNEVNGVSKVDSEDLDVNGSALPEAKDSPKPTVEVKLDPDLPCIADISTSHLDLLSNPGTQYQQELPNSGEFCIASENNICMSQTNISSLSSKIEQCSEKPFGNTIYFHDPSESSLESRRLKQTEEQKTSLFCRKPESSVEMGTNIGCQVKKHDMLQKSGSGLWPGLSLNVSHTWSDSPHKQRTVATLPLLMDAPCSTSVVQVPNGPFVKVTKVVNGRRSCKKCAAHVYISLLIQALKRSANIDKLMVQPNQREHEGLRQGGFVGVNTSINVKRCFNEAVSSSSTCISTAENVPNEAKNGIHQHKKLHLDQQVFGAHTSPKQTVDFLSLSAGGGSLENIDSFSRGRRGMELLSQAQLPYLPSSVQHHNVIPFSLTRTHYSSSASFDRSSVAQQSQLLPSYGNSFCGPKANATALTKQPIHHQQLHHQQQQQLHMLQQHRHQQQQQLHLQQRQQPQQQRLWAAQLATQYRPAGTLAATVPSPSWQNMKQENGKPIQRSQAFLSPSPSTLELVGPKFASLSHQQQQLMTVPSSFPPGRVKWQDHHLPSVYEESASGYRSACSLPLQLLCNDRL